VSTRASLSDAVWSHHSEIHERTVPVHIRRLRKPLTAGARPDPIRTVRSEGYAFDAPSQN
jgi:two-component system phosphate regulon response regulator PhoB